MSARVHLTSALWLCAALPGILGCAGPASRRGDTADAGAVSPDRPGDKPQPPPDAAPQAAPRLEEGLFSLDYGKLLLLDAGNTATAPARWDGADWLTFGLGSAAVVGTAAFLDKPVKAFVDRNRTPKWDSAAKALSPSSVEVYSMGALAAFYLAGLVLDDREARTVGEDGIAGSLITATLAQALKWSVGRSRPVDGDGPYTFHPFGGKHSFPSGHATQAFTGAAVIASHYDSVWVDVFSYGAASLIGLSRIEKGAHWTSDVAAGAFIGIGIGQAVVGWNRLARGDVTIEPVVDDGTYGIEAAIRF